jgi:hypothetical protein
LSNISAQWSVNIFGGDHKVFSFLSDSGSYAGLPSPDQLDGGYKPQTKVIPTPNLYTWNIIQDHHHPEYFR